MLIFFLNWTLPFGSFVKNKIIILWPFLMPSTRATYKLHREKTLMKVVCHFGRSPPSIAVFSWKDVPMCKPIHCIDIVGFQTASNLQPFGPKMLLTRLSCPLIILCQQNSVKFSYLFNNICALILLII